MAGVRRRSLLLTAPRQLTWVEDEIGPPGAGEVLVETVAGAISIGSELPLYLGTARQGSPERHPRMTGYENMALVRACGYNITNLRPGDRVVGFYGHRTHAVVPEAKALPVPPQVSDEAALLAILTCDVAKGIRKTRPERDDPVLVTGAGAIGLLTVWMLRALGPQAIDVIEPRARRRALAIALGARSAEPPDAVRTDGETYAVGIECSSAASAFAEMQSRMSHGGSICVLADGNREPLVLSPAFHERELSVVGSSDGEDYQAHARWYFAALQHAPSDLTRVFDTRCTADELPATFERLATGDLDAIKVYVEYR